MPYTVTQFQPTPNPNAMKCVLDRAVAPSPRSYRSRPEAPGPADDPLAAALFAVPGVAGLLLNHDWVTVTKEPGVDWAAVKTAMRRALASAP